MHHNESIMIYIRDLDAGQTTYCLWRLISSLALDVYKYAVPLICTSSTGIGVHTSSDFRERIIAQRAPTGSLLSVPGSAPAQKRYCNISDLQSLPRTYVPGTVVMLSGACSHVQGFGS
jgi:hypothetical protein